MKWLTLEQIKAQLRIEPDFHDEDTILKDVYGESAEETLLNYLNRPYHDIIERYGKVPLPLVQASLMLVDVSYQHRSPISVTNISLVPYTFDLLVKPYMRLTSPDESEVQTVTLGSDVKIEFTAELPDDLTLSDVDFSGKVLNADMKDESVDFNKADCIELECGKNYVVMVDSDDLGIGTLMLRLTVFIPDTDYQSGTRKEVIKINPHIRITG
jgi:hypothetical protein